MSEFTEQQNTLVQLCLSSLLEDKTTGKNIVFATDSYADQGEEFAPEREITADLLPSLDLKPRILKSKEEQEQRTRKNADGEADCSEIFISPFVPSTNPP